MHKPYAALPMALLALVMAGCQAQQPTGSLAQLKRTQESRVMFDCIKQNTAAMHANRNMRGYSGLNLELIDACREYADASVW